MPIKNHQRIFFLFCISMFFLGATQGQTEVEPWGNITGIRVDGQLMEFKTSLQMVSNDWSKTEATALERQRPKYNREGNAQIIITKLDSFLFTERVEEDVTKNMANVLIQYTANRSTDSDRLFFVIRLLQTDYANGSVTLTSTSSQKSSRRFLSSINDSWQEHASGVRIVTSQKSLQLTFAKDIPIKVRKDSLGEIRLYIPLQEGAIQNGQTGELSLSIKAGGVIDKAPVTFRLNVQDTGRPFTGFGGNFRLQNPKTDPQVIDYCLKNMRVAWSRVEMPLQLWQPEINSNPIDSAKAGKLHPHVKESMEMAARLGNMGIPVIVTAWSAPRWAITGDISRGPRPNGVWGNPLDTNNMLAIYKSIADYLIYLREAYGVEASLFSFNESDLGINIRQTGQEHAQLIKGLGAYFKLRGLHTKMLLGDNSDANTYAFIGPAMKDTATHQYIGAVSFHSWRGWEKETLQKWADAATQMDLPLIVGEGSIDAAAWNYPAIFEEQTYAVKEINLYTRLMAICQPLTILQWQLTADYSPLIGGGIFGNNDSLHPGQRFWNLKQLASIPKDLSSMPITTSQPYISCAAQGNNNSHTYALHIVNDGATRTATLTGLPSAIKKIKMYVTSKELAMKETSLFTSNGKVIFQLLTESYTTLVAE